MNTYLSILITAILATSYLEAKTSYFWHITDIHLDLNFSMDGDIRFMCWETNHSPSSIYKPKGKFGDYRCDSTKDLLDSAITAMRRIEPKPTFILWTGGNLPHVSDKQLSPSVVLKVINLITDLLKFHFPQTIIYPVLGNLDYFPKNELPATANEMYDTISEKWSLWMNQEAVKTFKQGGFYTVKPDERSSLRLVALNTGLYYRANDIIQLSQSREDPAGQFGWLESVLQNARKFDEKVLIFGHVPPGMFERYVTGDGWYWLWPDYNARLVRMLENYADVIEGSIFGHQHTDTFRVAFKNDQPVGWIFLSPSLSPWKSMLHPHIGATNPGVRLYEYDDVTGKILDYRQYWANLTEANYENWAKWHQGYSFKSMHDLRDISPRSLNRLAESIKTSSTAFQRYYASNRVGFPGKDYCDGIMSVICQKLHYCAITNLHYDLYATCSSPSLLTNPLLLICIFVYHLYKWGLSQKFV